MAFAKIDEKTKRKTEQFVESDTSLFLIGVIILELVDYVTPMVKITFLWAFLLRLDLSGT